MVSDTKISKLYNIVLLNFAYLKTNNNNNKNNTTSSNKKLD